MTAKDKFYKTVLEYNMLSPGDTVLVGVSGGADSMCLLHILWEERSSLGVTIGVAHINHGIRGEEAKRDERFVRDFCEKRDIPFHLLQTDIPALAKKTGESVELCARNVRYQFFSSLRYDKIATAHTGTDTIETFFFNLSRGSALRGLTSIPPVRGNIIRPLICFTRTETEQYCSEHGLQFVTDSTNASDHYTRNRFRHQVLTPLKEINPSFEKNALRCIASLRRENSFLEEQTKSFFSVLCDSEKETLFCAQLITLHPALRLRIISAFISAFSNADYEERHLQMLDNNLANDDYSLVLPSNETICIQSGSMFFHKQNSEKPMISLIPVKSICGTYKFGNRSIILKSESYSPQCSTNGNAVDVDKLGLDLCFRSRQTADRISFANRGCSKTLKKLFSEEKIPPEKRSEIPVLADSKGVIWVDGFGADASRLPDAQSKKILIIKSESGNNVK